MSGTVGPRIPPFMNTYSLDFDGVDDYVTCGYMSELDAIQTFTISMWVKFDNVSGVQRIIGKTHNAVGHISLASVNDELYPSINGKYGTTTDANLVGGTWYHIAMIFDGTLTGDINRLKFYIDGMQKTLSFTGTIPSMTYDFAPTPATWYLGTDGFTTPNYYGGLMDEVGVFNTAEPIANLWDGSGSPTSLASLNPVAWYRMGDNGLYKDPQWLIPSNENKDKVSNYSMDFDGTGNFVDLGDSDDFSFGNGTTDSPFSISAWIKIDSTSNFRIFNKYEGLINEYQFGMGVANNLQFYIFDSTSTFNYKARVYNTILNTGQWYHVAATYSGVGGTNAQDGMKIYVDGIRVDDSTVSGGSYVAMGNKTTPVYIGKLNTSYANGLIDEVSVYASELSQNDVTNIYNGGTPTTISGAISHWKLGEDSTFNGGVWTVPDSVGTNDGTSANMTIEDRVGTAPSSSNNSLSFNMDLIDRVPDTPPTP